MSEFLRNLLTASIHGSVVILAVIFLRLILRKTPKKYICLMWLLAGIRLLLPIEIRSDFSLQPEFALPNWDLPAILPWVWSIVALCFGIYSTVSYWKLKNKVREAVRIRGGWECDRIETAFILGFIKPRIYIPMGMNRQYRKHILEHERTHLDKGDHWIKMIGFLALALHWFNPLVWIAYILLCRDIEMACDERVVQFMELEERKSYSAALLSCSGRQMHLSANPVAFGEVSVKQRILSVLNYKKPGFWISALGVVAFFFVAVCLVTSPAQEPETVVVKVPLEEFSENTPEEINDTAARLEKAWSEILNQERYHLLFHDEVYEGGVGWQINVYKDGKDTLWKSTDHRTEEGHMVLDGVSYKFIDGSGWVVWEESDTMLTSLLEHFDLKGKVLTDITSESKDNGLGYTFEELSFNTHTTNEAGETVTRPMKVFFDTQGKMTGMRVENTDRKGADIFSFSDFTAYSDFNNTDDIFRIAKESIVAIEDVHPSLLEEPTQDEQRMKEWGIQYLVDDDLLTQYGSEVWFCQSEGYDMTVHTDNEYWLEKQTDTGWEKLETIVEPEWAPANYTLGHGMYTMTFVDWSELYGPLPGGTYRMGKKFEKVSNGGQTCVGYAEFVIHHNDASTEDQTAAVERCYAALDKLTKQEAIHWYSNRSGGEYSECWMNGEDYLTMNHWEGPEHLPYEEWDDFDKQLFPRTDTSVRYNGIGYSDVHENPDAPSSKVLGMGLSTLSANRAGWNRNSIADDFLYGFFERSNHTITFPEGVGVISDEMVRFVTVWPVQGLDFDEASAELTYKFDRDGNLTFMSYKALYDDDPHTYSIEIFDTSPEEIDAKIKPYTENLIVDTFSWNDAKAKYTDAEFNIREDSFVNNGGSPINGPVDAAKLALKEYPNLGDYLSLDVLRDDSTGMWKVTIESYVDYQSTYAYRDVYLSDSGATQLLVYEGPIGWDESRK